MRVPLALTCCLLAASLSSSASAQAEVPHDLMQLVPLETTSASQWRSDGRTAMLEDKVFGVVDALLEADLDTLILDACEDFGAPEDVMREVRSVRNLVRSMGGLIPWRELLHGEVVYAESNSSGMLLASRPDPDELERVESCLAGAMGTVAGMMLMPLRYDVEHDEDTGTKLYQVTARGGGRPAPLLQFAVRDGVFLLGFGQHYFDQALALLKGSSAERLATSVRYLEAFGELPEDVAGRTYVDMAMMAHDLEGLNEMLSEREFNSGGLQGLLNGMVNMAESVETVASVVRCDGNLVSTETLTRFDPESSAETRAGLAQPASAKMLTYIPADAYSFDMRGKVKPASVFTWMRDNWSSGWEPADNLLFAYDLFEAAIGLSFERDVLSWMGSEQIQVHMPSRHSKRRKGPKPGESDTITICHVRDPEGVRKCIERLEGVFEVLAPVAVERTKELLTKIGMRPWANLRIESKYEEYPELRRMWVSLPMVPMPPIVYGMVDDILVYGTSMEGVATCLAVASGAQEGIDSHRLAGPLLGREDLCSARMTPAGSQISGWQTTLGLCGAGLGFLKGATEQADPRVGVAVDLGIELVQRGSRVLASLDFLGETLTFSTIREQGLARYEESTMKLRLPEARGDVAQTPAKGGAAKPVSHAQ